MVQVELEYQREVAVVSVPRSVEEEVLALGSV
jgi:hypothetical protein